MKKPKTIYNESDLRRWIFVEGGVLGYHVSHVESHVTSRGIPDLNFGWRGGDIWLELKVWRDGIHMLPAQRRWHRARNLIGGKSFVLCYINDLLYCHSGHFAATLSPVSPLWKSGPPYPLCDLGILLTTIR